MGDWRGSREFPGRKPSSSKQRCRKPPIGSWKPTVPAWEKEFCATVCLIPWWKVCEAKKIMPLYENVVQWNDSAGEEAFSNAKKRFWAKINGLPCDVSLPDPDIYIDEIDWDSIDDVDPELLLALEQQEPIVAEKSKGDSLNSEQPGSTGNNWENFVVFSCHQGNNLFPCSGWGDGDDWARGVNNCTAESNRWKEDFKNNGQATQGGMMQALTIGLNVVGEMIMSVHGNATIGIMDSPSLAAMTLQNKVREIGPLLMVAVEKEKGVGGMDLGINVINLALARSFQRPPEIGGIAVGVREQIISLMKELWWGSDPFVGLACDMSCLVSVLNHMEKHMTETICWMLIRS
ncbi:hypothetical protein EJ110_NYTH06781 [Nymphaea thermarum]|nr:hypothetical protein EJ110_NYTH06781 [Nymphaea thermarum]